MMKLSQKKRNTCLAFAVAASILGGGSVFAAETADYTATLNGMRDPEYEDVIGADGVYKFTQDTRITSQYGVDLGENMQINAEGKNLTFVVKDIKDLAGAGIKIDGANSLAIKANTVKMDLTGSDITSEGLQGVRTLNANSKLTIDGKLDITANGDNNTIGIYNRGNVVVSGDVKLDIEGNNGGYQYYGATGLYATSAMGNSKGGTITVNGNVDFKGNANGIWANAGGAVVNVNGGSIVVKEGQDMGYAAIKAENGIVNMNVLKDEAGNVTGAADNAVTIKGNLSLDTGAVNSADVHGTKSEINLGLSTAESSLTGVVQNSFAEGGKKAGDKTFTGDANLWLQNGATWNNEVVDTIIENPWGGEKWAGSRVTNFTGGESEAKAGNIFQKDNNSLTINNYSGYTNIFYAHEGNGEAAENYKAGDTIIKHAAEGSVVSLITDNTGISMNSDANVANVLNALAGKLTYSNFANGEKNLTGYVKIADGLTASSKAQKTGDIAFTEEGKGSYVAKPEVPTVKEYTNTLTGFNLIDKAYADVFKDGVYKFTEDSKITNKYGMDIIEDAQIDAAGKTLTLVVNNPADQGAGIKVNPAYSLNIKADTVKMELTGEDISSDGLKGVNIAKAGAKLTIDGKLDITANGDNNTIGVYNQGDVVVNGDVKLDIEGNNGGYQYYGATGLYATSAMGNSKGGTITVNGNVDFKGNANGIWANAGGAVVNVNGGSIVVKEGQDMGYAAIKAENGIVNMNVLKDEAGNVTGAADNAVTIKGNLSLDTGAVNSADVHGTKSEINLGLSTAESSLTGVVQNSFAEGGKKAGDKTFTGDANLWLQNGATWNNEVVDTIIENPWGGEKWAGSRVTNFTGGESEAKAGNIFQKDNNSLTINNYSGNTNIFYAHTGNGEAAENYAAGDTIIKHAEKDSVVSLITDNTGIAMDSEDSVANVLNTLAGKLTYSNFVNGEKNLTGLVKIADGLTASSTALKTGNIAFSTEDGKGSLNKEDVKPEPPTPPTPTYPEDQKADKFDQGISGNDEKYKEEGVLKEDGSYVFTKNPTAIEVKDGAAVGATDKDIVIDTTKAKLVLKGETGIKADGADVNVKGSTDISGKVGIDAVNGNVTINGSTVINGTDAAINAGEGANVDINTNNSALNIKGDINANGGNITVDSGKATGTIESNVTASNGGNVEISLNDKNSTLTGAYNVDADSSIVMNIANGSTWNLTDDEDEASGMSLMRMAKAPAATAKGLTLNGGKTEAETGFINLQKRTKDVKIANYSGWETFIYSHEGAGDKVSDYKSGDTIIDKAAKGSGVILSTDNSGINMKDKNSVEATLKALAQKVTYNDHEANGDNLTGKVQIAGGLTASSKSQNIGTLHWDENGKGQYNLDSVNWNQIIEGDYETFVMKGVRSAATTSLHTWRDNMQDTYTGADMADEDGMFAKALGGKTSSDVKGLKDSNTYYGVQVGYDKAAANGWHTGVAFDYRNGDSNYLLGGKGDNQMYSLGVYGVKNFENDAFFRVAAKVGRVENEYDVYNEIRSLKLNGDYKANAYGLTMEYGKTFGDEEAYFTPKAQLTWSQVGAKDYTAHTDNATMQISQDSYSSFVGRLGFEAGVKSEKGRVYAGLFAAHEFNGDISASYFANDGDRKHTNFDGEETWMEMKLGGTYDFSNNAHLYADIAKDFNGNFERKWKMNVGLRFEF